MPSFTNLTQLEVFLKKTIKDSMEDVGKAVEYKVREKIDEVVYNSPATPDTYNRTYELKNSLIHEQPKQSGNETTVVIKHEDNLLGHYAPNQHQSVVDGSPLSVESLAEIVMQGKSGHIFGQGYWTEPRPYMDIAKEEILAENLHVTTLKSSLRSKGIMAE